MSNQGQSAMFNKLWWGVQRIVSRIAGLLCECEWRWIKNPLIRIFMRFYHIDLKDCVKTRIQDYKSLNEFFIRPLRPGARPLNRQPDTLLSPVDGCISQIGAIQGETLLQAKGKTYTLYDLLARDQDAVNLFKDGLFCTFYLAPSDYHRVHMPITGTVVQKTYVPGFLFSVGNRNTQRVSQLFTRNERVISLFKTTIGPMAIIQVGSCLVGHMGTVWEGVDQVPHRSSEVKRTTYLGHEHRLDQTAEMGYFKLGSTVILLLSQDAIEWQEDLYIGKRLYCCEYLAKTLPRGLEPLFTP